MVLELRAVGVHAGRGADVACRLRAKACRDSLPGHLERRRGAESFVTPAWRRLRRSGWRARLRRLPAAVLVLAAGCGFLNKKPQDTPAQIAARASEDARILREVEARLAAEPSIGAGRVRVEVQRGEVGL